MAVSLVSTGVTFPDNSTQTTAATGFGFKNRIINGAMVIDQRNAGASVTPAGGQYYLDRWYFGSSQASKFTAQRNQGSVTLPAGFINYFGFTSSSAYSVLSTDFFLVEQPIEGLNVADFGWGTANAQTVTLSFKVYSSLTGTFSGAIRNSAADRSYPFSYSIPVANTWTTISITISGDTSGTWLTTNGIGVRVAFSLGAGSTLSGTANAWAGANYISATGATSVVGTNGATFYITGVQLEKGSTATSFDYRPIGTELQLAQRYFETLGVFVSTSAWATIVNSAAPKVVKRATPTLSVTNFGAGSGAVFTWSAPSVGDAGGGIAYQTTGNSANAAATLQISIEL